MSLIGHNLLFKQTSSLYNETHPDRFGFFSCPAFKSFQPPPSTYPNIIIIDDDDEEEDKTLESKNENNKRKLGYMLDNGVSNVFKGSLPSNNVTLEPMNKKPRLGDELSNIFMGSSSKSKEDKSIKEKPRFGSWLGDELSSFSKGYSSNSKEAIKLCADESISENATASKKDNGHVSFEDLSVCAEDINNTTWEEFFDPTLEIRRGDSLEGILCTQNQNKIQEAHDQSQIGQTLISKQSSITDNGELQFHDCTTFNSLSSTDTSIIIIDDDEETLNPEIDVVTRVDSSCFSSTDLQNKNTNDGESTRQGHDVIDLCLEESVSEKATVSKSGNTNMTLEELGVTVEDLKKIPWEAFDPNWEISSVAMDPWLGGYIQDLLN